MLTGEQLKQLDVFMKSLNIGKENFELISAVIISESIENLKKELSYCIGKLVGTMEKNTKEIVESIEALK